MFIENSMPSKEGIWKIGNLASVYHKLKEYYPIRGLLTVHGVWFYCLQLALNASGKPYGTLVTKAPYRHRSKTAHLTGR
ncbi:hypothetical protein T4E_10713 [Trichinella pseudospiralis]|uniref:Uncharacterized protein n=1 Tax=Trichinella pseudospiralis TaxID=6337 RepID=A0A0V0XNY4_TRIPS|nr:hypothetical protein T4E_10713 [Trichinella pseudospiralis]